MEESIHGMQEYQSFQYKFTFSTTQAVFQLTYMTPTIVVMLKIFMSFRGPSHWNSAHTMNHHIYVIIMLYFLFNTLFFLSDFLRFSLPATGILTSWSASIQPNHFLNLIFFFTFYFNYCILILPLLLCLIRLIILIYPKDHPMICSKIMIISLPLLFLIPLCCTSFMIPALGYCRQMGSPLNYGATYIYYSGGWDGWRNSYIHLVMSIVMCSLTILCSVVMLFKLRQSVFSNSSARTKEQSKRAESSLSFTMISFIIPFINNTMLTIVYLTFPGWVYHMMIFRPFGNDCETVMMPWILYMTHPMFRRKRTISQSTAVTTIPRMNSPIMH
ncbi:Serpentine Receptor, class U [Caenorhabditis elegans]|uniref:Serpentine Receptor, class U n=1 Tax=Caenorhabditis elegans TaxID=6239 RepID=Q21787_CAEEL|nr:Serpentine Receptor, class U [Caenorhabditis elegans]CAA96666.1 Serpentine Receptor, class U [Caenorhabditis elegans]|eukprot:NP_001256143.1 Serpentine Receptor, class U [Caenorhabditis elegans]